MCDDGPCYDYATKSSEDVRATKQHAVSLTLLVQAEDARKAAEKVLSAYEGTGIEINRFSVTEYEQEDRW